MMNTITIRGWVFASIVVVLSLAAYERNRVWKNEYILWKDVVQKSPNKAVPHVNLGNAFVRRCVLERAEKEFKLALEINPRDIRAINGLAVIYLKQKNYDEAIRLFEILAKDKTNEPGFDSNLGVAYMGKGLLDKAIEQFKAALNVDPDFPDAHSNLGLAYKKKGMLKEAKEEFEKALQLSPEHIDAKRDLDEVKQLLLGEITK
ncbi:MAG: tetratricopeptide repeat protein [Nitrospirae bacterium]|nr:MAG: tetratricopeptide repeat protein [Nitrospirota bacterium]